MRGPAGDACWAASILGPQRSNGFGSAVLPLVVVDRRASPCSVRPFPHWRRARRYRIQISHGWFQSDKLKHFAVAAPFGAPGAYLARDTAHPVIYGRLIGTIPGLIKEGIDGTCRTSGFSYKDLAEDVAGALTGALLGDWAITCSRGSRGQTVAVAYSTRF
ncbi:hypothetical protein [Burkholderia sp. WSM2230]|uniref:hypothetical protein n=1 Tax=Burkholderia sp. WSM2230 TaxID=944435 RepID=UPI001E2F2E6D|nr:hypothetical protein [Burkholderia sp. WSM2230]